MKPNRLLSTLRNIIRPHLLLLAAIFCASLPGVAHAAFTHPGVMFNRADLDRMKANLNVEPWKSGYANLVSKPAAAINYVMRGPFVEVGREPNLNRAEYENDMDAVFYQAIQWYMTGNATYANKAMQIIDAWSTTHTRWSGRTPGLLSGDYGLNAVMGCEILRHTYPGWTSALTTRVQNYFINTVWWMNVNDPLRGGVGTGNQGASHLKSMIGIAVFCNDQARYDQTVNYFRNDVCVSLGRNSLASGQNAEAGRDQPHPLGGIQNFTMTAETAWKQGTDLYADLGNRLLTQSEYWTKYNLSGTVPYAPFGPCNASWNSISATGRGYIQWATCTMENIYGAYVVRKGMSAPSTQAYRATLTPDFQTFLYKKTAVATGLPPAGTYSLRNRSSGRMLDNLGATTNGSNVAQWQDGASLNQRWVLSYVSANVVKLQCVTGGLYLDGLGRATGGSIVGQWPGGTSNNQRWTIIAAGDGYFKLKNVATGLCVDVSDGPWINGQAVNQWPDGTSQNMHWQFVAP